MIKVLHFFKTSLPYSIGGIEQVIDQICVSTREFGIDSKVLALTNSLNYKSKSCFNGYELNIVKTDFKLASTDFSLTVFKHFKLLAQDVDIIHYHFPWPLMDLAHLILRINKPTVVTYHSDIVKQKTLLMLYKPLMKLFLNKVNIIIATSANYANSSTILQIYKDKVEIIPIGLNQDFYSLPKYERLLYWKNKFKKRFFLFVGVLRYYKGLHIILEANIPQDIPIVIAGDGPLRLKLMLDAEKLGLKNIHFIGQVSDEDKVALLTLSYAILFPSHLRSEAFGISLLEGAMYGKPMISCEIGTGTSFINENNITGIVIRPNNPEELKIAVNDLWKNPSKAQVMGNNARTHFNNNFTANIMAKKYYNVYNKLFNLNKTNNSQ
jgi:rhamnosyl/mannosyltransferase